ncbi:ANF_receptor domain-containing protein [Trichonephila clavipes]|nr:ANF_receptor domain-containing protein [Trichonephila clavipes]
MVEMGMNEWLISLDPTPEDLADALFHFLTSQEWYEVTLLLDESLFSESVSRRLQVLSNGPPMLKTIQLPSTRYKIKEPIRGRRFATRENIANTVRQQVIRFTYGAANAEADGIQCLSHRWQRVVTVAEDYNEGL